MGFTQTLLETTGLPIGIAPSAASVSAISLRPEFRSLCDGNTYPNPVPMVTPTPSSMPPGSQPPAHSYRARRSARWSASFRRGVIILSSSSKKPTKAASDSSTRARARAGNVTAADDSSTHIHIHPITHLHLHPIYNGESSHSIAGAATAGTRTRREEQREQREQRGEESRVSVSPGRSGASAVKREEGGRRGWMGMRWRPTGGRRFGPRGARCQEGVHACCRCDGRERDVYDKGERDERVYRGRGKAEGMVESKARAADLRRV
ncbi:hypothetical protein B0H16DRAFT_968253 [Mycena metata]|uniref:Uncharacterized protein n=1 Tax=Mycena metata TaxID=1033252 RepID=A0AAD7ILR9_9AGAR|nr:hypothetical protein B0H16DRAFT_968253 [Mycena metata]